MFNIICDEPKGNAPAFAVLRVFVKLAFVPSRVSTEFRRHGIPSVFFTSVYSVFRAELAKIPAEFRRIPCPIIP